MRLHFASLVLTAALAAVADAGDRVTATELKVKSPVRQALAGPDGTLYLLEGDLARSYSDPEEERDGVHRILLWDLAKNRELRSLADLPPGAVHMGLAGSDLVVACGGAGVAVVDSAGAVRKIATPDLRPFYVSSDASPGRALVVAARADGKSERLLEIDLASGELTAILDAPLSSLHTAVATATRLAVQRGSGGTYALPSLYDLTEARGSLELSGQAPRAHRDRVASLGPENAETCRAVNGHADLIVSMLNRDLMCFATESGFRCRWQRSAALLAVHPTKPLLLAREDVSGRLSEGTEKWRVVGLHTAHGLQVWAATIEFDFKVQRCGSEPLLYDSQTIVPGADHDRFVFAVREWSGPASSDVASAKLAWLVADLPAFDLAKVPVLSGAPDTVARPGERYVFAPALVHCEGAKFSIERAPPGVVIDEKSARVSWTPTAEQVGGPYPVQIQAELDANRFVITSFAVRVASTDEIVAELEDFSGIRPRRVVPSFDGRTLFLVEEAPAGAPPRQRILAWDSTDRAILKGIKLPEAPADVALVQSTLVVACTESQRLVLIDPATLKVSRRVPLQLPDGRVFGPSLVHEDSPRGEVVVSGGNTTTRESLTFEVGLDDGAVRQWYQGPKGLPAGSAVLVAGDFAIWNDRVMPLDKLREWSKDVPQAEELRSRNLNARRVVNEGRNVLARSRRGTALLSPDGKDVEWEVEGSLLAVHPTKPLAVVLSGIKGETKSPDEAVRLTLRGVHTRSGRRLWQRDVKLRDQISFQSLKAVQRLVPAEGGAELLFSACETYGHPGSRWFRVRLPDEAASPIAVSEEPRTQLVVGARFEWAPASTKGSAVFVLKAGPEGMTVDARTGKLAWTSGAGAIGEHHVVLVAKIGAEETVIDFPIRVSAERGR